MTRSRIILLVEDNPDDADLTLHAFEESRVLNKVVVARDGEEALNYLFPNGDSCEPRVMPAVVLLDLNLPKIDGLEVLRHIRADERTRRLPVVVLTSSKETCDIGRCYDAGANSFVQKPVDFARFMDAARQLGLYWLGLNEPVPAGDSQ